MDRLCRVMIPSFRFSGFIVGSGTASEGISRLRSSAVIHIMRHRMVPIRITEADISSPVTREER